jgi:cystathionine beta-synthase
MSDGKIQHLRAMGAKVVLARSDVQKGHPEYYQDVAERLARETPNSLYINQFFNDDNVRAHYEGTGPEIKTQVETYLAREAEAGRDVGSGTVDVFIAGIGTGGTMTGVGRYLKEHNPNVKLVAADPAGSIIEPLVNRGEKVEPGSWLVEGMGEDFVPGVCDIDLIDEAVSVPDGDSFHAARNLLRNEGLLVGSSTGCLMAAAEAWCKKQSQPLNVVTLICDQGAKYLSKMFNDFWMIDNGFIEREQHNDIRDLIARRHALREDYTLTPQTPLKQAIRVMELQSISQLAVLDHNDRVVGIIDESDILLAVTADNGAFEHPVDEFMTKRLETIRPEAPIESLMPIFRADRVAIVQDESGSYLGLITKIDLIDYLRRQLL